ncbi:MAG: hypothetical protein P4L84_04455 [Isosphaeraceae bacterium]|nr:hypothetical protein [Isosphaeraceae bacterium]
MDAAVNASRWSRWVASGTANAISKVLSILDANLPDGWKRLTDNGILPYASLVNPGPGWYARETSPSCVGIVLSIERPEGLGTEGWPGVVCGAAIPVRWVRIPAAWGQVSPFLDQGVAPAAKAAGADLRVPTLEDAFLANLPLDAREHLREFSDAARKLLPLSREEAELWREFVVVAFRAKAVVDAQSFVDWLAAADWPRESAAELNRRFSDQCLLLSRYADEVSAA